MRASDVNAPMSCPPIVATFGSTGAATSAWRTNESRGVISSIRSETIVVETTAEPECEDTGLRKGNTAGGSCGKNP
jgi:hypothetical protein